MKSINHPSFFDPDSSDDNRVPPKTEEEEDDHNILLCDECEGGNVILQHLNDGRRLQCPSCTKIYNPHFELIKHKSREYTIDSDDAPSNSGIISFLEENSRFKTNVTRIRAKLQEDEMPDYLKQEIDHIKKRTGYEFIKSF